MAKKIVSIACEFAHDQCDYVPFDSNVSLLDWDIIIFKPEIYIYIEYSDTYLGKPALSESSSFKLKEQLEHWRRELLEAYNNSKTIIIILSDYIEFFIDTGKREYNGTGKNRKVTRIVDIYDNYRCIPFSLKITPAKGKEMKLSEKSELISSYWQEFSKYSEYRIYFENKLTYPLIYTKTGNKIVSAYAKSKSSEGCFILLPYIDTESEDFYEIDNEGYVWTEKGKIFGNKFISSIIEIDKILKKSTNSTPAPYWTSAPQYDIPKTKKLSIKLLKIEKQIEKLQKQKDELKLQIQEEESLKWLLYEKGILLEKAVLKALTILGFRTSQYRDSDSEFDVIFISEEGRFLGEVEGKDNKAIGIEKLRQLEINVLEDFDRDEVDEPAKGVLFGNAFRLKEIEKRNEFFTHKCITASLRSKISLVRTTDLFLVANYLAFKNDPKFASECRKAILKPEGGIVKFPSVKDMKKELITEAKKK